MAYYNISTEMPNRSMDMFMRLLELSIEESTIQL